MDECLLRWNYTDIESHIINDKCPPNFDGFNCWPPILINTSVSLPCPPDFLIIENDVTFNDSVVTRYCNANFTWDAAQYAECLSNYAELYSSGKYCFIATILLKYFVTAGFFWMFVEGLYLLVSVRFSFQTHFINYTMCAIIGWGIPMLLVIISSVTRKKIPHDRKIAKGLFVLCPLLGTTYIFTLIPPQHPPWLKLTFSYSTTVLTSTQGIVIAVLFCFSHSEVLFCIKKSCSQFMEKWRLRQSNCYIKLFDSLSEGIKETTC
ncbi:Corticotropin-releasing factor receptor 1 [Trichinella pseudospiralis]|uniref:Corticotropin-releasing factor receptor 1 n=1 Tax=Trichinella pseudospiralis TaxID=6337 RepID=A0A0V1JEP1_TRIPS|nr:Corticotropin-releasing factor receptor 1 [Trichinella pseudospiralis]